MKLEGRGRENLKEIAESITKEFASLLSLDHFVPLRPASTIQSRTERAVAVASLRFARERRINKNEIAGYTTRRCYGVK